MNLSDIQAAVKSGSEIEVETSVGKILGAPRISWKKRELTLKQANGCKSVVSFDDILGF
jgi:hypothetical protein